MGCGSSKDLPVEIHEGAIEPSTKSEEETQPVSTESDITPDHSSTSIPSPGLTKQNGTNNLGQSQQDSLTDESETRPTSMSDSRKGKAFLKAACAATGS